MHFRQNGFLRAFHGQALQHDLSGHEEWAARQLRHGHSSRQLRFYLDCHQRQRTGEIRRLQLLFTHQQRHGVHPEEQLVPQHCGGQVPPLVGDLRGRDRHHRPALDAQMGTAGRQSDKQGSVARCPDGLSGFERLYLARRAYLYILYSARRQGRHQEGDSLPLFKQPT